jgi:hypothetical protein
MSLDIAQRGQPLRSGCDKTSGEERNRGLVLRNFRAFDSGDVRTFEETTAPSFVDHNPLEGQLPGEKDTMQASAIKTTVIPNGKLQTNFKG